MEDLLGNDFVSISQIPAEKAHHGIKNVAKKLIVTEDHGRAYMQLAKEAGTFVSGQFDKFSDCPLNNSNQECIESFLNSFAKEFGAVLFKTKNSTPY